MSVFKELNISNPGTSIKFGANDLDMVTKLFNAVIAGIAPVRIRNQNKFGFDDAILWIYNQALSRKTTIRGQSNVPATDVDLRLPPIVANDVLPAIGIQNIFSAPQQFNAGTIYQEMIEPASPPTGQYVTYIDSTTKHLIKKNSAGQKVDYDVYVCGGEVNTASNLGAGVGIFKSKVGLDLQFKSINAGSGAISITNDVANNEVDINVPNSGITYAKIQNITSAARILGRITSGAGIIEELTATQLTTLLDVFTSALKGLVPSSGGGTTNYLRADGTWASPVAAGAPSDASYVTITTDATLSNERPLAVGDGLTLIDGGSGNPVTITADPIDKARRRVSFIEDFFAWADATSQINSVFVASVSGTGASVDVSAVTELGVFGVWQLQTGTTITGRAAIIAGENSSFSLGQGQAIVEMYIKIPTLSVVGDEFIFRIGFGDSTSGMPADGVLFEYDRLTSVNWRMRCRSNSVSSATNSTTAVGTGWTRLKVVVNAAGTSVDFFIGGSNVGTTTTNIPVGAGRELTVIASIIKSAGTTSRTARIDYIAFDYDLTTPR